MAGFLSALDLRAIVPDVDENKATQMIEDATALAVLVAPCINDDGFTQQAAVRAILRGAVLRWLDAGSGAFQQQTAGPFSQVVDTRQAGGYRLWPSEITQLQSLCSTGSMYTLSLAGPDYVPGSGIPLA